MLWMAGIYIQYYGIIFLPNLFLPVGCNSSCCFCSNSRSSSSSSNIKHNEVIYIWCHFFCVIARGEREREVLHDIIPTMEKLRDTSVGLYTTTTSTLFALQYVCNSTITHHCHAHFKGFFDYNSLVYFSSSFLVSLSYLLLCFSQRRVVLYHNQHNIQLLTLLFLTVFFI